MDDVASDENRVAMSSHCCYLVFDEKMLEEEVEVD